MDDHLSKLQLWEAEKNMLLFFNELNTYYDLIKGDLNDYDQEDMEILAMDIDNALTALSGYFCIGLNEEPGTITSDQVEAYFKKIHDHIIENEDIAFATDIVESDPHFTPVQDFLVKYMRDTKTPFRSITLIDIIKEQVYDIIAWAELWHVHHARDIHDELSNRSNTAIKIIIHDPDLDEPQNIGKENIDSTKAFRNYFIKDYDAIKIAKINAKVNELGKQKKDGHVAKLAALAAVLFTKKVLSKTYKETLTYLFLRFSIKEDAAAYKPAQFKRPSMKGTVPARWTEAESFFNSLDISNIK